jgi:hypothetical protein
VICPLDVLVLVPETIAGRGVAVGMGVAVGTGVGVLRGGNCAGVACALPGSNASATSKPNARPAAARPKLLACCWYALIIVPPAMFE